MPTTSTGVFDFPQVPAIYYDPEEDARLEARYADDPESLWEHTQEERQLPLPSFKARYEFPQGAFDSFAFYRGYAERELEKRKKERHITPVKHLVSTKSKGDASHIGDMRLRRIEHLLYSFDMKPSPEQMILFRAYVNAALPFIYEGHWEPNRIRVMKQRGIDRINPFVIALASRRFGKSVAVAMISSILNFVIPGFTTSIFSTCKRTSGALTSMIRKFLMQIPGAADCIVKENQEELHIAATSRSEAAASGQRINDLRTSSTTSVIKSLPGSQHSKWKLTDPRRSSLSLSLFFDSFPQKDAQQDA